MSNIWIFVANDARFPSGVFIEFSDAESWILLHELSGVLTEYPINVGCYDWAVSNGYFVPRRGKVVDADFIGSFVSVRQRHFHYEFGRRL